MMQNEYRVPLFQLALRVNESYGCRYLTPRKLKTNKIRGTSLGKGLKILVCILLTPCCVNHIQ